MKKIFSKTLDFIAVMITSILISGLIYTIASADFSYVPILNFDLSGLTTNVQTYSVAPTDAGSYNIIEYKGTPSMLGASNSYFPVIIDTTTGANIQTDANYSGNDDYSYKDLITGTILSCVRNNGSLNSNIFNSGDNLVFNPIYNPTGAGGLWGDNRGGNYQAYWKFINDPTKCLAVGDLVPIVPPPTIETCSDGIQNQNETGIDTGGVCAIAFSPVIDYIIILSFCGLIFGGITYTTYKIVKKII